MGKGFGCAFLLCSTAALMAQPAALTYRSTLDDSDQPYALYLPKSLDPKSLDPARKYPLVVGLHEEDSNHVVNLKHIFGVVSRYGETALQTLGSFPPMRDVEYIVVCPFARGSMGYQGIAEQDVYDVVAEVKRRYPVDEDRVYLTGSSMGGGGALWMALTRPDVWAAVAPVCAATIPGSEELAGNALNFPVRLFQGELDPAVPAESSRQWQRRFLEAGVPVDYIEFPAVRHNAWDSAYRNASIFEWFGKFKRDRDPNHVRFATRFARYNSAYWLRIDGFAPGALASIDAVRSGSEIRVQTKDVDAFTLALSGAGEPLATGRAGGRRGGLGASNVQTPAAGESPAPPNPSTIRTVTIDGAAVRLRPGAALSFTKSASRWTQSAAPVTALPRGPIVEAVNGRHIYVYGAGDEQSRRDAQTAAAWSNPRVRINLKLPVKSDQEVSDGDIASANLILFGNQHTNRLIARFAPQLPLMLNPGAADYGLVFVVPAGKHFVLVNSGLPWWTGADDVKRGGDRFAPEQYRLLSTFGDYILFKGSLSNVLAEGRFDRSGKVPQEAAAKLEAAGTVAVR